MRQGCDKDGLKALETAPLKRGVYPLMEEDEPEPPGDSPAA